MSYCGITRLKSPGKWEIRDVSRTGADFAIKHLLFQNVLNFSFGSF